MFALAITATPGLAPGIVGLFIESGWMGKVIMVILLGFSIVSWAMILLKYQFLRRAERESRAFLAEFRKTKNVKDLLKFATTLNNSPLATLYVDGHKEADASVRSRPEGKVPAVAGPLVS